MRKLILFTALIGFGIWVTPSEAAVAAEVPAYSLTDVGTFGGPQAFLNIPGVPITARGTVLGTADTTIADPNYPISIHFWSASPIPSCPAHSNGVTEADRSRRAPRQQRERGIPDQ